MTNPKKDKDYLDFFHSTQSAPPSELDHRILGFVKNDLTPGHHTVFLKLLSIQAFVGFLTLIFCPQFDLSLTHNYELFHYFHHTFGASICMTICGALFMGSGALFAAHILKSSEIRKIKESRLLYYFALSLIALSCFSLLGSEVYLTLTFFWLLGSLFGGILFFEVSKFIRKEVFGH